MKLLENVPISTDAMLCTLVASIFSFKVTLVNLSNYSVRDVTWRKVLNRFSPINIGYNDETLLTFSLNYVNEDRNKYADIPSIHVNVLKHDNLGCLHFYTPYSGPSNVFLRS